MRADSIAKDASTLPQTAAPVDFSTAKTVIRHHCARKWSRMAKPAVLHATYVNRDQDKGLYTFTKDSAFTPLYKRTYTRAGMVPQQNYEKPRPAWTSHMSATWSGRVDTATPNDLTFGIGKCTQPPFWWRRSHHFSVQRTQSSTQLLEGCWPHRGQLHMILDRAPEENNSNNCNAMHCTTLTLTLTPAFGDKIIKFSTLATPALGNVNDNFMPFCLHLRTRTA